MEREVGKVNLIAEQRMKLRRMEMPGARPRRGEAEAEEEEEEERRRGTLV